MNAVDLPTDIFLLIIKYLSPSDLIVSRSISKKFLTAFTDPDVNRQALLEHYPRVRELRDINDKEDINWSDTFAKVAARYGHLKAGKPQSIEKLKLGKSLVLPNWARNYPISNWHQHLEFEDKRAPFHYPDTLWTYDDGLLIFPSAEMQTYVLYDLQNCRKDVIDIESTDGKVVRRIRVKEHVLIVEWCEENAYHQLNESEMVYRHFATAYDLVQDLLTHEWHLSFRNEWKIHFLGMPLNSKDRFYSCHSASYYALYRWQPNRSGWGEDDPIEALTIWDISPPSEYRPSKDPTGKQKGASNGPTVIRSLTLDDLDFYQIRQRSAPVLRGLELDENHIYIIEEDHRWLVGEEASHILPRLHKVRAVGIPFGIGPRSEDSCGADGDMNISFCERDSQCRSSGIAPCWRHEEFPYLTISEVFDEEAGVRFAARHCFMLETITLHIKPKVTITGPNYEVSLQDDLWSQLLGKGKTCGDERWVIGQDSNEHVVIIHFDKRSQNI